MGRDLRTIDPELPYHVFCRGSNRGHIVLDSLDCHAFVRELDRIATKFNWEVYAWCLMPNHHHLVVRTQRASFSAGYQQLNGNHSRRTNKRHGWSDHLFRNRPRVVCCESTAHLIGAIAYVVRNPVAAGLVQNAASWQWSSYRATMGLSRPPRWLRVDAVLKLFGSDRVRARIGFDELVHRGRLRVSDTEEELLSA